MSRNDQYGFANMQNPMSQQTASQVAMAQQQAMMQKYAEAQQYMPTNTNAAQQNTLTSAIGNIGSSITGTNPRDIWSNATGAAGVRSADLDNPLFTAPLVALRDMWLVAYGNAWVAEKNMKDDKEWYIIFERLKSAMEHVYLQDKGYAVHRIAPE